MFNPLAKHAPEKAPPPPHEDLEERKEPVAPAPPAQKEQEEKEPSVVNTPVMTLLVFLLAEAMTHPGKEIGVVFPDTNQFSLFLVPATLLLSSVVTALVKLAPGIATRSWFAQTVARTARATLLKADNLLQYYARLIIGTLETGDEDVTARTIQRVLTCIEEQPYTTIFVEAQWLEKDGLSHDRLYKQCGIVLASSLTETHIALSPDHVTLSAVLPFEITTQSKKTMHKTALHWSNHTRFVPATLKQMRDVMAMQIPEDAFDLERLTMPNVVDIMWYLTSNDADAGGKKDKKKGKKTHVFNPTHIDASDPCNLLPSIFMLFVCLCHDWSADTLQLFIQMVYTFASFQILTDKEDNFERALDWLTSVGSRPTRGDGSSETLFVRAVDFFMCRLELLPNSTVLTLKMCRKWLNTLNTLGIQLFVDTAEPKHYEQFLVGTPSGRLPGRRTAVPVSGAMHLCTRVAELAVHMHSEQPAVDLNFIQQLFAQMETLSSGRARLQAPGGLVTRSVRGLTTCVRSFLCTVTAIILLTPSDFSDGRQVAVTFIHNLWEHAAIAANPVAMITKALPELVMRVMSALRVTSPAGALDTLSAMTKLMATVGRSQVLIVPSNGTPDLARSLLAYGVLPVQALGQNVTLATQQTIKQNTKVVFLDQLAAAAPDEAGTAPVVPDAAPLTARAQFLQMMAARFQCKSPSKRPRVPVPSGDSPPAKMARKDKVEEKEEFEAGSNDELDPNEDADPNEDEDADPRSNENNEIGMD